MRLVPRPPSLSRRCLRRFIFCGRQKAGHHYHAVRDDQDCATYLAGHRKLQPRRHPLLLDQSWFSEVLVMYWHLPIWRPCTRSRRTQGYQSVSAAVAVQWQGWRTASRSEQSQWTIQWLECVTHRNRGEVVRRYAPAIAHAAAEDVALHRNDGSCKTIDMRGFWGIEGT